MSSYYLKVKTLFENYQTILPERQTEDSAGYDICSYDDCVIPGNSHRLIDTGLSFTVPEGTYGQLMPRSSLSCKGLLVGAGVIDRDYTGHVKVLIHNLNSSDYEINAGDRVAQLILINISTPDVIEVESLQKSVRGEGGFGSTGV
jgi:dUTP pyrophosphatase